MSLNKRLFPKVADAGADATGHFDPKLYTGNSSTQSVTGVGFQPDLIWIKSRHTISDNHYIMDSVRGKNGGTVFENVYANLTNAQANDNALTSMDSDGFTLSNNNGNASGRNYVAWCWKAGGAPTATNTATSGAMTANSVSIDGALQSSYTPSGSPTIYPKKMSINNTLGFSIVEFVLASPATSDTIPHGLDAAPDLIISKTTSTTGDFFVYHKDVGTGKYFQLNRNYQTSTYANGFSTVDANKWQQYFRSDAEHHIAYCFTSKDGLSKIGSYEGNNNSTGVTITTGFQPRLVIIKPIDITVGWAIFDAERGENLLLASNNQSGDYAGWDAYFDFLSDGFKVKGSSSQLNPASTVTYIAFA